MIGQSPYIFSRGLSVRGEADRDYAWRQSVAVLEAFRQGLFRADAITDWVSRAAVYVDTTQMLDATLSRQMQAAWLDLGMALATPTFPLVSVVAMAKAVAFRERVEFGLTDPRTGLALTAAEAPVVDRLGAIMERAGVLAAMAHADQLLVAERNACVRVRMEPDSALGVVIEAMPGYVPYVVPNPRLRGDPSRASEIWLPESGDAYPDGRDELRHAFVRGPDGTYYGAVVDPDGNAVAPLPGETSIRLETQAHPIVLLREEDTPDWRCPVPRPLRDAQNECNVHLARAALAVAVSAHGQTTLEKTDKGAGDFYGAAPPAVPLTNEALEGLTTTSTSTTTTTQPVRIGSSPHELLVAPDGWRFGSVQARVDVAAMVRWVQFSIQRAFVAEDLVPQRVEFLSPQPSNWSGAAMRIQAEPMEGSLQHREARLARQTAAVLRVWAPYWNRVCAPEDRIPEGAEWSVTFGNLWSADVLTNQSAMQGLDAAAKLGLVSLPDVRASIDGVPATEGRRRYWAGLGAYKRGQEPLPPANPQPPAAPAEGETAPTP